MRFLFFGFSLPVLLVALVLIWTTTSSTAFPRLPKTAFTHLGRSRTTKTSTTAVYFFGGPKDDGSPGDYVCLDCGYVFTQGPKAWAALPDNWSCPPCGSIKRRFKKVPKGSAAAAASKVAPVHKKGK